MEPKSGMLGQTSHQKRCKISILFLLHFWIHFWRIWETFGGSVADFEWILKGFLAGFWAAGSPKGSPEAPKGSPKDPKESQMTPQDSKRLLKGRQRMPRRPKNPLEDPQWTAKKRPKDRPWTPKDPQKNSKAPPQDRQRTRKGQ